jgi:hypothetical protein
MALLILAAQLALGGLLASVLSRGSAAEDSSRDLRRAAVIAAGVAAAVELVGWGLDGVSAAAAIVTGAASGGRWLFLIGGLFATPGAFLVLVAGRAEHGGDLARARRVTRRGGFLMAGGALVSIVADLTTVWLGAVPPESASFIWASLTTAAAAGIAGLLAGLAGKPRPTGYLAAALLATSVFTWLAAL